MLHVSVTRDLLDSMAANDSHLIPVNADLWMAAYMKH